jgi:hypothetical protein
MMKARVLYMTMRSASSSKHLPAQINMLSKITAAQATGSYCLFGLGASSDTWAFFRDFPSFADQFGPLTLVRAVSYAPIVTQAARPAFEQYARDNIGTLGLTSADVAAQIRKGVFMKVGGINTWYPANASNPVYFPVGQIAPIATNQAVIMYDLYSEPNRRAAIDLAMASRQPATTDIIQLVQDTAINAVRASGLVFVPTYASGDVNKTDLKGMSTAVFSWDDIIVESLPSNVRLYLLLESSGGRSFSFFYDGTKIINLGNGDTVTSKVSSALLKYKTSVSINVSVAWTLIMYPATSLWDDYVTSLPRDLCVAVVTAIVGVVLLFLVYDFLTSGRTQALDRIARATTKMLEDVRLVSRAHDFEEQSKAMRELAEEVGVDVVALKPREIERRVIMTLDKIGSGAFGDVYKVCFPGGD